MDDPSYFIAQSPDAAKRPLAEQPWMLRAQLAEGNPYTFCLIMDGARADGAAILRPHSDAVWFIELFATKSGRGPSVMVALQWHVFPAGRGEFRVLALEALGAKAHGATRAITMPGKRQRERVRHRRRGSLQTVLIALINLRVGRKREQLRV